MSIAEKLIQIAENEQKVYEAGKASMIDESKIIEKTATGTGVVALDDVSELPHNITVQLSGDNVAGKQVTVYGKNLLDNDVSKIKQVSYISPTDGTETKRNGYEIHLPNGTYAIRTTLQEGETGEYYIYGCVVDADNVLVQTAHTFVKSNTNSATKPVVFEIKDGYVLKIYDGYSDTAISSSQKRFQKFNIQIECDSPTSFEPYVSPTTYTANADGVIEGIKSISPYMTFVCEDGIDISVTYRADWGIVTEREKAWNGFLLNGTRKNFAYAFANGYTDEMFHPLTNMVTESGTYAFSNTSILNLYGSFKKYGTKLDTSRTTTLGYYFQNAKTYIIPEISLVGVTSSNGTAYAFASSSIVDIKNLIFKDDGTTPIASTIFTNATSLKEIRVRGTIGQSISFKSCPLSVASMKNIITHLKNFIGTADELTYTITFSDDCWAALEADSTAPDGSAWREYIDTKLGWLTT